MATDSVKATDYARVRDRLFDDLVSGHYQPGERLTVATLVARYGTSATPVRAALQELQGRGLVTTAAHQGARVRAVDPEFIANLYELRAAVLAMLMPKCVRHASLADIEQIEALQDRLERAAAAGDAAARLRLNHDFHDAIHRLARNPEARDVMERTWLPVEGLRQRFGFGPRRWAEATASHRALIDALRRRDATEATRIALESSERAKRDLIECVQGNASAAGTGGARRLAARGSGARAAAPR